MRNMDETGSYMEQLLSLPVKTNMKVALPTVSTLYSISTIMDLMTKENVGCMVAAEGQHRSLVV